MKKKKKERKKEIKFGYKNRGKNGSDDRCRVECISR